MILNPLKLAQMKCRRWNDSYWCPTCRKNVHWSNVVEKVESGGWMEPVMERSTRCPHCDRILNYWAYGSYELLETKTGRFLSNCLQTYDKIKYRVKSLFSNRSLI